VLLGVAIYFEYGVDPGISGRYGLALAPFLVLALVASIRGRWIARGLWLFAVASFGLDVFFMLAR
ncbi:MAG TPA: hypothetical protein VEJ87_12605, partial [Acidimicrobiales bacterium]|nr:hypothetical protein [Acidimicrobiales bacterium]